MFRIRYSSRTINGLIILPAILVAVGCGEAGNPRGTISGDVKYQGQPVTAGEVNLFQKATGVAATAPLDASGHFELDSPMPAGTYNVSVIPPVPKPQPPGTPPEVLPPFPVPVKYQDPAQSDLTAEVRKGENQLAIVIPE